MEGKAPHSITARIVDSNRRLLTQGVFGGMRVNRPQLNMQPKMAEKTHQTEKQDKTMTTLMGFFEAQHAERDRGGSHAYGLAIHSRNLAVFRTHPHPTIQLETPAGRRGGEKKKPCSRTFHFLWSSVA